MYRDFDRAREAREPLRFKMRGREYELPGDPPAVFVLELMKTDGEVTASMAVGFVRDLVGVEKVEQMVADGLTMQDFSALIDWLMATYNLSGGESGGNGKGANGSSSTGTSSKPTSLVTTVPIPSA